MNKKWNTEKFRRYAEFIKGDKYDYRKFVYINNSTKGLIIHKICGNEFLQSANSHMRKKEGCPFCGGTKKSNTETFIKKSKMIHGDKYDYSKFLYKNNSTNGIIVCNKNNHGEFLQNPNNHLNNHGCPKCKIERIWEVNISNLREFIKKSNLVDINKYDYSKSIYINDRNQIEIICKKHGSFWQTVNGHLNGRGCPKCSNKISKSETKFLNYIGILNENRQIRINKNQIDGFDSKTNTIYEFLGDYFHGNPNKHNRNDINRLCKKSFGELYDFTFKRLNDLKNLGYNVKYVWESDWKNFEKQKNK